MNINLQLQIGNDCRIHAGLQVWRTRKNVLMRMSILGTLAFTSMVVGMVRVSVRVMMMRGLLWFVLSVTVGTVMSGIRQ
jgi:hypothetical protein